SPRNKAYFIEHNPEYEKIVDILPNAIKVMDREFKYTRKDFGLDDHKTLFIYGGNLGIPQNIPYLIMCARAMEKVDNVTLVVCGSGGKQDLIESYISQENPKNFVYLGQLPKDKYDEIVHHCDVGLIFLDERFTIPNYPQRVLSYLQAKLPIISATDSSTDVGSMAEENGYGYSVMSPDVEAFIEKVKILSMDSNLRETMGEKGYQYLLENYTVNHAYKRILEQY
ncbi:MAG: glycosyltransferase family 4 protein, partial [Erysipelothrix sp.]|nr:glycosyltransferase family 4 protein [Erysipelothrix sp.]